MTYAPTVHGLEESMSTGRRRRIPRNSRGQFKDFVAVRDEIDGPLLEELFPVGQILRDVHWESHDNRIDCSSYQRIKKKRLEETE